MTDAPSPAKSTRALYEDVADQLRQRIFAHKLAPGSWIDEKALSEAFGISRTPMREALKVLAAEGLVTMKLRRGAYVTEVSQQDQDEVFGLLALLEGDAAAEVALKASDAQLAQLRELHTQLLGAEDDVEQFFALNESFHMTVLEMGGNRWRLQLVTDLRKVLKLNRHQSLFKMGRMQASLQEHEAIVQALSQRNAELSRQLMQQHLSRGREALK